MAARPEEASTASTARIHYRQIDAQPDIGRRLADVGDVERAARDAGDWWQGRVRVSIVMEVDSPRESGRRQRAIFQIRGRSENIKGVPAV